MTGADRIGEIEVLLSASYAVMDRICTYSGLYSRFLAWELRYYHWMIYTRGDQLILLAYMCLWGTELQGTCVSEVAVFCSRYIDNPMR
jgi:hypothetical protein